MKRFFTSIFALSLSITMFAQGWPAQYGGVMLQGFYWDSFTASKWTTLTDQADELSKYFTLIWVPQSGNCSGTSMGYNPKYYFDQNSTFGTDSELRTMISTFKAKGIGTIADVVINHRANLSNTVDFPSETYGGVTYQMLSTDILSSDDNGTTKAWATKNGYQLSANGEEYMYAGSSTKCEDFSGYRDLDHQSENVQKCIKAYENFLVKDLGYTGFRYDVAKGFAASHTGEYNNAAGVQYSVGEVWEGNTSIVQGWINGTKVNGVIQSAAFDFPFRYSVSHAIQQRNWSKLSESGVNSSVDYRRYSVTFVENHDVEARDGDKQDCLASDTLAANAWLLANPGTPCVFFKHWLYCKNDIAKMIAARKLMGINNQSTYTDIASNTNYYAREITGTNGKMIVCVGYNDQVQAYTVDGYKTLLSGVGYKYLVPNNFDTSSWTQTVTDIDKNVKNEAKPTIPNCATKQSGIYAYFEAPSSWSGDLYTFAWNGSTTITSAWPGEKATVTKVGTHNGKNVYLWKYSGTGTTLPKYIIFDNGQGGNTNQTADFPFYNGGYYTFRDSYIGFADGTGEADKFVIPSFATKQEGTYAYFEKPDTWGSTINVWAWSASGSAYSGDWPGTASQKDIKFVGTNPETKLSVYLWKYSGTTTPSMIIFNDGSSKTGDLTLQNGGYYTVDGLQGNVETGISPVIADTPVTDNAWYTLNGMRISTPNAKGIYIHGGKKVVVK